jgi:hypothetical protein
MIYIIMHELLEKYPRTEAQKKQEAWRQKQINIFYNTGRPIFGHMKDNVLVQPSIINVYYYNRVFF